MYILAIFLKAVGWCWNPFLVSSHVHTSRRHLSEGEIQSLVLFGAGEWESKNEDTSGGDKASLKESIKMKMKAGSWVIPLHYRNCIFQNVDITYCWLIIWQELQGRLAKLGAENEARKRYV